MVKKRVKSNKPKHDKTNPSYTLGIVSIVLAFFQPIAAIIIGIVGLSLNKDQNNPLARSAKKMNTVGIILGAVIFILLLIATYYFKGLGSFPV